MSFAIETRDLARRFGTVEAVRGLDMRVPEASLCAFLGPNGAGKSTTLRLLLGLLRADRGTVEVLGRPVRVGGGPGPPGIAALLEHDGLYPHLTGRENLQGVARLLALPPRRVGEVLDRLGLADAADRAVAGYSLGMRRRLGLARCLLTAPRLLLLDEPLNGLDPAGIRELRQLLRTLPDEGVTVFLSSHQLAEVQQLADHLVILDRGALRFQGPAAALGTAGRPVLRARVGGVASALETLRRGGWTARRGEGRGDPGGAGNPMPGGDRREPADGGEIVLEALPSEAPRIVAALVRDGHDVYAVQPDRPTLEAAFLAALRDDPEAGPGTETGGEG